MTDPRTGIDLDRSFVDRPFNSHPITKAGKDWRGLLFFAVVFGLAVFL